MGTREADGVTKSTKRDREERERLRRYQARQRVHEHGLRARRRDNVVALIAGIGLVAAATVAQIAYFELGPGSMTPGAVDDANDTDMDDTDPNDTDANDTVDPSANDEPTSAPLPGVDESIGPEGTQTPVP